VCSSDLPGPQSPISPVPGCPVPSPRSRVVTVEGAAIFCWALQRLVLINCSSLERRNWQHGAVAWRVAYLMDLSTRGGSVHEIDRLVRRIKIGIWAATVAAIVLTAVGLTQ
jgi:hypothetical protein